ncbi:iron-containing alcohol dehydrogenase [Deinococcus maricopensis]|uniref:Alcohol dehydrogenase (NADP(+)) n=1 Tax=Deinococcus maricopensis (strain DSM 21211 / LMG 22137 / NRRL B-23946 / LB-34) TaxID=709986 RepID=E8U5M2_DEIML|nr:iron-containing alcohol dehydrogenase [Deinococcus maricopensis]ADV66361.1 Alcohol dehydrogenase (NADP(+)) [Deinococcus maricopensis DSM 21211]
MQPFSFQNPTRLHFGAGQLERLRDEVPHGAHVLLVYGGGSIKRSGLYDQVHAHLQALGAVVTELAGVEPNPRLSTVRRGVTLAQGSVTHILAVGGGSVIDAAKAIAVSARSAHDAWDLILNPSLITGALPLGVVLTHAATGSEMNPISVITNEGTLDKRGWASAHAYPTFSILDPAFTLTAPRDQTAYGLIDMMSHVLEDYLDTTTNTPVQDAWAEGLLRVLIDTGPKLVADLGNLELRETAMLAGTWAFNGALAMGKDGDWASHRIEHALSALHDVPHAAGLSVVMPAWMEYAAQERPEKLARLAERVLGVHRMERSDALVAREGITRLRSFWRSLGAPTRLHELNIPDTDIPKLAELSVLRGEPFGNLRPLGRADVEAILRLAH